MSAAPRPSARLSIGGLAALVVIACQAPGVTASRAQPDDEVLARARAYVAGYERAFVDLLSEERSTQELREPGALSSVPSSPRAMPGGPPLMDAPGSSDRTTRRRLRANYLIVRAATGLGWVPFRDVVEVDGRAVGERERRLGELLSGDGPADLSRARRLMVEGARHDLGDVARTFNIPVLGLLFAHPDRAAHASFARGRVERVGGRRAVVYEFAEQGQPTLVRGPGDQDVPSTGRLWVDEATGAVLKTEHRVQAWDVAATVTVEYRHDERLQMWLPERMDEEYRWSGQARVLRVSARYADYHRLQVQASESEPAVPRKPPGGAPPGRS